MDVLPVHRSPLKGSVPSFVVFAMHHGLDLFRRCQQVVQIRPSAHLQPLRNPFEGHRRLPAPKEAGQWCGHIVLQACGRWLVCQGR